MKKYDLTIVGGGTAGCAAAYIAAKQGLKVLLLEKNIHLGGAITSGLVIPVMHCGENQINTDFYQQLIETLKHLNGQITYHNNDGWFNPELTKLALDILLEEVGVETIFCAHITDIQAQNNQIIKITLKENLNNYLQIHSKYFIDATGDGEFSILAGCKVIKDNNEYQPMNLRFTMSGIDLEKFSNWLLEQDSDRNITSVEKINNEIHLSTAYTWDSNKKWALAPFFETGVKNNLIKDTDRNYFQVFTVAGMSGTLAFNCPRIIDDLNPNSALDKTIALKKARKAIFRLAKFCKKTFPGFEKSFISNIADSLGVRVSNRIEGKYIYTIEDLRNGKKFDNKVLISNYPVDVHTKEKNRSLLEHNAEYQLPLDSLITKDFNNLFVIGRCLSSDYLSQGALRVQSSCFSMGEGVAKHIVSLCNTKTT